MADSDNGGSKSVPAKVKPQEKKIAVLIKKIKKGASDIRLEMKRVTWPTWKELFNYTVTVLVVCVIMGALIYVLDISLSNLMRVTMDIQT